MRSLLPVRLLRVRGLIGWLGNRALGLRRPLRLGRVLGLRRLLRLGRALGLRRPLRLGRGLGLILHAGRGLRRALGLWRLAGAGVLGMGLLRVEVSLASSIVLLMLLLMMMLLVLLLLLLCVCISISSLVSCVLSRKLLGLLLSLVP